MLENIVLLFSLPGYGALIGLPSSEAAVTAVVQHLGTSVGRPIIGIISDRCGRIETAGIITLYVWSNVVRSMASSENLWV